MTTQVITALTGGGGSLISVAAWSIHRAGQLAKRTLARQDALVELARRASIYQFAGIQLTLLSLSRKSEEQKEEESVEILAEMNADLTPKVVIPNGG